MTRQQEKKNKSQIAQFSGVYRLYLLSKTCHFEQVRGNCSSIEPFVKRSIQYIRSICLIAATALLSLKNNLKERKPFLEMICRFLRSKRKRKYFRLCSISIRVYLTLVRFLTRVSTSFKSHILQSNISLEVQYSFLSEN